MIKAVLLKPEPYIQIVKCPGISGGIWSITREEAQELVRDLSEILKND